MPTMESTQPGREGGCERCGAPTGPGSARFCAVHRAEHAAELMAQILAGRAGFLARMDPARRSQWLFPAEWDTDTDEPPILQPAV
jgi:hypothetical protein